MLVEENKSPFNLEETSGFYGKTYGRVSYTPQGGGIIK